MSRINPRRRPTSPAGPDLAAVSVQLLDADERSRRAGLPLLTPIGRRYLVHLSETGMGRVESSGTLDPECGASLPHWDRDTRQLWLGSLLVKVFRQPAPNQTALLDAFQAHGWEEGHVPNLLPPEPGENTAAARQRLHDTIKNLNRALPQGTIYFRGDGGLGAWWAYSSDRADSPRSSSSSGFRLTH
jgi:hypothetical protein